MVMVIPKVQQMNEGLYPDGNDGLPLVSPAIIE